MTTHKAHILVVDDDLSHCTIIRALMTGWGYQVSLAHNGREAVERTKEIPFDLIVTDVRMSEMDGIEALKTIKAYNPAIPILIMTAYSNIESAVDAIKSGAYDYLTKPLDFDMLQLTLARALEHTGLKNENKQLKQQLTVSPQNMIGRSPPMRRLMDMVAMIAPSDATVLICGASGTGKELIARSVHANSARRDQPLVIVNCAALSESLLESELFGHEKGAFTGADKRREGRFMAADKGTLFLDEIGEISLLMQAKLLRAIQEREIQRVGSNQTLTVDVRLIAATNRDLKADVDSGKFRQDLYYRLNVMTIDTPALKDRSEDIPALVMHFLEKFTSRNGKSVKGFTPQAMDLLLKYNWPGNVRELENAVERAVILLTGDFISEKELPLCIHQFAEQHPYSSPTNEEIQPLEQVEKQAILAALEKTDGNKTEAAKWLKITRKTLLAKLQKG
ncbi:helix-turn-helix, Fis-type [Yersinia intermedia]|uniref:Sigma-54-dependent Fis family transcriptional regulator n=1 Tax=Yersinia intermedia TaxID=631 RepID=A0ABX6FAT0_YERIN|nr:sigma-54-dependent Fis family transcriptional regulator [Yersinia intermedia]OVZ73506.1 sigma-54-dependent Fis family transcriptional regulator [Yersinia intermedia]QGR65979.1 sigma-54-dependent Fis family transcriptional regulator [Yersinia intermedia]QGR70996.1 sigma-54-dependent Fis family transcriptional regulator [Yersinia intermedia]VDZ56168.1 helix-turn-helix, Fis-type [Yersinia intermedia]